MNTSKRIRPGLLLGLGLLGLAACSTTGRGGPVNSYKASESSPELISEETNRQLSQYFHIADYRSERRDGRLVVQFDLVNKNSSQRQIEWRIQWFDNGGFHVASSNNWKREVLPGYGSLPLSLTAPNPEITEFELELRPPNSVR